MNPQDPKMAALMDAIQSAKGAQPAGPQDPNQEPLCCPKCKYMGPASEFQEPALGGSPAPSDGDGDE